MKRFAALSMLLLLACGAERRTVTLWAWERPEDLRFVSRSDVTIAYWAGTVTLSPARLRARRQALRLPNDAPLLPVVRIESSGKAVATSDVGRTADAIDRVTAGAPRMQIDFDARVSERPFYRALINELKTRNPQRRISVTALASWCLGDPWIESLGADEVVPMFFDMGADELSVRRTLARERRLTLPCSQSAGLLAGDAVPTALRDTSRIYLFSRRPWTAETFQRAMEKVQ